MRILIHKIFFIVASAIVLPVIVLPGPAQANETLVGNFQNGDLSGWEEKEFAGSTHYQLVSQGAKSVLQATTDNSASALYREIKVNLNKTPILQWSWKINETYPIENGFKKAGDDYPARIYVVVRRGIFPWQTLALNYVWANKPVGASHWFNPYTQKAVMVPIKAGETSVGEWHLESTNVKADFKRFFDVDITEIDGIAIMSDSDNAGFSGVAYYGDIRFSAGE